MPRITTSRLHPLKWGPFATLAAFALMGPAAAETPAADAPSSRTIGASAATSWALIDTKGRPVSDRDLKGKPSVISFGFTYCPDICPTTLLALTEWMKKLGNGANKLNVVFITVDPARDTPAKLAQYLSYFDPRIRGLTGTSAQVAIAAKRYGVSYQIVPADSGEYSIAHSSNIYLADRDGRIVDSIGLQLTEAKALEKLRRLSGN